LVALKQSWKRRRYYACRIVFCVYIPTHIEKARKNLNENSPWPSYAIIYTLILQGIILHRCCCLNNIQFFTDIKIICTFLQLSPFVGRARCTIPRMYYSDVKCMYFNFINIFISLSLSRTHVQRTIVIIRKRTVVCVYVCVCVCVCAMGGGFHKNRLPRTLWQRFRFPVPTTFHREDSVTDIRMMRV